MTKHLKILISGSSGLIGSELKNHLVLQGHLVYILKRSKTKENVQQSIVWDPLKGRFCLNDFENFDLFIHLSGESLDQLFWTNKAKQKIYDSRVASSQLLAKIISQLKKPPKIVISASAIGYYGYEHQERITETTNKGNGFLADLCSDWENAWNLLDSSSIRLINMRLGVVLSRKGGMLKKLLPFYTKGIAVGFGSLDNYFSWISLNELIHIFDYVINQDKLRGVINCCHPVQLRQKDFIKSMNRYFKCKFSLTVPSWIIKLFLGDMGKELILSSLSVYPKKLEKYGYVFKEKNLENFLASLD